MEKKKESAAPNDRQKLDDELLDQVSGGYPGSDGLVDEPIYCCKPEFGGCGNSFPSSTIPKRCIFCARPDALARN